MVTVSSSGVVAIALANTGFVLLSTMLSQVFAPGRHDLVKMLKDDLAHLSSHRGVQLYSNSSTISKASGCSQYLHSPSPSQEPRSARLPR